MAMGTWGSGPFNNDAAADFLGDLQKAPARGVVKALREIANAPAGKYIEIDDGGAAWAACELVALAFGHGGEASVDDAVLGVAAKLAPSQEQRRLAMEALARLADRATSELAGLWHEGNDGSQFDALIADLRARLEAASNGPRELPKAKTGDVICLPAISPPEVIVVQVVSAGEVAVMEGVHADDAAALEAVKSRAARRVPAPVNKLLRRGRLLANVSVRRDIKGKKLYAGEMGAITHYLLSTANAGGARVASYDEVRNCDVLHLHDEESLLAIALGTSPVQRVRSPDEREAALVAENAGRWAQRRNLTTPGPFGDVGILTDLVKWVEDYGVENAVQRFHEEATGMIGYGRPNEDPERRSYAFVAVVAIWRQTWSSDNWPAVLTGRLPAKPNEKLMEQALSAARTLAAQVLDREAELRLIWENGSDRGTGLHDAVASLQKALS